MNKIKVPTPHIEAKVQEIAKNVIMPGDPLRAKFIAEKFLSGAKLVNKVRNMYAYTGKYKDMEVTVMGSGMGCPSMGIYSYELFNGYDVENIIRVGTAGGVDSRLKLGDIVLGSNSISDSNYINQVPNFNISVSADFKLLNTIYDNSILMKKNVYVGNLFTTDIFYTNRDIPFEKLAILAVEMETAALYYNAMHAGKRACAICTISDLIGRDESMSSLDRENTLVDMIELGLESIIELKNN